MASKKQAISKLDWRVAKSRPNESSSTMEGDSNRKKISPVQGGIAKPRPSLGRAIVHVLVGPQRQDFGIHRDMICNISTYFRSAFTNGFEETTTGIMKLPETGVTVFELFAHWLYFQTLWNENEEQDKWPQVSDLIKLYIFADMVHVPLLMNHTIHAIESISKRSGMVSTKLFSHIWEHTPDDSLLRKLMVDMMVWTASKGVLEKLTSECFAHDNGMEIMLDVMKAMRQQLHPILREKKDSPLKTITNYYVKERSG